MNEKNLQEQNERSQSSEANKVSIKRNALLNVIKQVMKIAFPLITFPYVSRILLDENFGKYNFAQSIINYFVLIAGLGVTTYGVREGARIRNDPDRFSQFADQLFTVNVVSTVFSYIFLFLLSIFWRKLDPYQSLLIPLSGVIFFNTLGADWINTIYEDYGYMTKRYISIKTIALVLIFLFIKKKEDYVIYGGIIAGTDMLANLINIFYIRRYTHLRLTKPHLRKHMLPLLVLFSNTIAITIYTNSDITMLGIFQNDSVVGIYSVASKMNQIVKNLINAIIVVIIPRLAALRGSGANERYNALLQKAIKAVITFMFPMIAGMFMLSKEMILLFGGEVYMEGSHALKILSIALIPAAISSVFLDGILIVDRKEKYCLIATMTSALVNIALNLILIPILSLDGAAITTIIAELCSCLMAICFSRGSHQMRIVVDRDIVAVIVGSAAVILICMANSLWTSSFVMVLMDVIMASLIYFIIQALLRNSVMMSILDTIKDKVIHQK